MSWERFERDFPNGVETKAGFFTADQLRQIPSIGAITVDLRIPAREMNVLEETVIYGKDNEEALVIDYNLEDEIEHPDIIHPLNVYGTAMLRDYLQFNYISPEELYNY